MKHQVSLLLLYDKEKRILLQHRSTDMKSLSGYWAFFGGHIENGETPEDALKRELLEELEYKILNPHLVMTQDFEHNNIKKKKYVFMEEFDNSTKLTQHEGQAMSWYHLDDIKKLKMVDHDQKVIDYIKDKY